MSLTMSQDDKYIYLAVAARKSSHATIISTKHECRPESYHLTPGTRRYGVFLVTLEGKSLLLVS
jgi:hypothetical protein